MLMTGSSGQACAGPFKMAVVIMVAYDLLAAHLTRETEHSVQIANPSPMEQIHFLHANLNFTTGQKGEPNIVDCHLCKLRSTEMNPKRAMKLL